MFLSVSLNVFVFGKWQEKHVLASLTASILWILLHLFALFYTFFTFTSPFDFSSPPVAHCNGIFMKCHTQGLVFHIKWRRWSLHMWAVFVSINLWICIFPCTVWIGEWVWNTEYMGRPPSTSHPHELWLCPVVWILNLIRKQRDDQNLPPFFLFS